MTAPATKQQRSLLNAPAGGVSQSNHEIQTLQPSLSPMQRQVAQWGSVIGNAAVQRQFIQRDTTTAAPAAAQTAAPSSLDQGIRSGLVAGDFAYDGYYKMDAAGGFTAFENPQLQTALLYYRDVWLKKFDQGKKDAQATKAAAQPVDPYARQETNEVAQIKALEGRVQTRKDQEKRIEDMYQKLLSEAKNNTQKAQAEAWRTRELGKVISVAPSADIEERWKAKQKDDAEGGTKNVDAYKADRPQREARKAVYEHLLGQLKGLDTRKENLKTTRANLTKLQGEKTQAGDKDGGEIGEAEATEKTARDAFLAVQSRKEDDPERKTLQKAYIDAQQVTKGKKSVRDGLLKFIPEEEAAIEAERFQLQAQLVHLAPTLKREDTEDVKKAQAAVQQKLAEEDAQNAKAASGDAAGGSTPQAVTKWHDLAAEVTSTKAEDQFETMKAETGAKPSGVVAGDTEGFNVNEHPAWFRAILPKLIGLGPQGSKGLSRAGLPAWDEDASGAQALLHSYLNAWTRWRLAENKTKADKKAAGVGGKVTPTDWRSVKIPSNLEVMNAAIGFSETNERSSIFNGLKGLMDWCGPATQKSIVLGLWKRSLMLRTEKVPQSVGNKGKIKDLIAAIDTEEKNAKDEKRAPNKLLIQKNWAEIGAWVKADLQKQDVFLISMYPDVANYDDWEATKQAAGIQLKKDKTKGDQEFLNKTTPKFAKAEDKRHLTGDEAATAPLYPGDFVYWVSSFEYGPMAGHVATIIEEKDRDDSARNADQKISQMRVNSGNAAGVVQGEGSVRPEGITRRVTGPLMAKSYYQIAGAGNGYYYGGLRDKYNNKVEEHRKLVAPQEASAAAREKMPAAEKKVADLQADVDRLSKDAAKNKNTLAVKQAQLNDAIKQRDQKKSAIMSPSAEQAVLKSPAVQQLDTEIKDIRTKILDYKRSYKEYPVHKAPNTPADQLGAEDTNIPKWADKKKELVSSHDNSVWIVSIVRSSKLDSNKLLAGESQSAGGASQGQKVDDETLGKQGVERMDPELFGYIKRFFGEGLGFPTLLLTEEDSKANAAARKATPTPEEG